MQQWILVVDQAIVLILSTKSGSCTLPANLDCLTFKTYKKNWHLVQIYRMNLIIIRGLKAISQTKSKLKMQCTIRRLNKAIYVDILQKNSKKQKGNIPKLNG